MLDTQNRFHQSSFGRAFIVTLFFVTLASGLFWLDFFRSYETEVSVLMVSHVNKGENSASISSNMAELVSTLSFYNRLIENSDTLDDEFAPYTPDQRKAKWNSIVSVSKKGESGVMVIHAKGETSEQSKTLAEETARTLFSVAGLYYNIETDIDMRVIDGPLVSYTLGHPWLYMLVVLLSSIGLTSLFFFFLKTVPAFLDLKKEKKAFPDFFTPQQTHTAEKENYFAYESYNAEETPFIDPKKFVPEKPETLIFMQEIPEVKSEKSALTHTKHASAPVNLPIASDEMDLPFADESSLPFTFETRVEEDYTEESNLVVPVETLRESAPEAVSTPMPASEEKKEIPVTEPTVEEYKRRLNELLSDTTK